MVVFNPFKRMSAKKKILIVEDEESLAKALQTKFTEEGFECSVARNGDEGIEKMLEAKPDLIILDILMPFKDGLTFLDECNQNSLCESIPVIVLTNLSDTQKVSQAVEKGVREYLVKADWGISDIAKKANELLDE